MKINEFGFTSSDAQHVIKATSYLPDSEPFAALQIIHGVAEHMGRYDRFARNLAKCGIAVYICDLPGHGKSATDNERGFFSDKNGWELVCKDILALSKTVKKNHRCPYFLMGHSMGSFLARTIHAKSMIKADGFVFMGSGYMSPLLARAAMMIGRLRLTFSHDKRIVSKFINSIAFGGYSKAFKNPRTTKDWISSIPDEVDRYLSDPLCGYDVSVGLFLDMLGGIAFINTKKNLEDADKKAPVLIISGREDPVGDMGRGPLKIKSLLSSVGIERCELELYDRSRHEILNDTCRKDAEKRIISFIRSAIGS